MNRGHLFKYVFDGALLSYVAMWLASGMHSDFKQCLMKPEMTI